MKEAWEWEVEDIERLIADGVQESLTLDYKGRDALDKRKPNWKSDLSKDVSAFANSAGGMIIYGVTEVGNLATAIDEGYDPKDLTRESIEQVINSTIQPRIDGIRIKQIVLNRNNPGNVIYVVAIPQSKKAPHMACNNIYYKRFNYQSVPMEDYEVRDVMHRTDSPDLKLKFGFISDLVKLKFEDNCKLSNPIELKATVINESNAPAMYYIVNLFIQRDVEIINNDGFTFDSTEKIIEICGVPVVFKTYSKNYAIPHNLPIWQGINLLIFQSPFQIAIPNKEENTCFVLLWSIDSIGMSQNKGGVFLLNQNDDMLSCVEFKIDEAVTEKR